VAAIMARSMAAASWSMPVSAGPPGRPGPRWRSGARARRRA
jgi:hypothetical protein